MDLFSPSSEQTGEAMEEMHDGTENAKGRKRKQQILNSTKTSKRGHEEVESEGLDALNLSTGMKNQLTLQNKPRELSHLN